jgi:excisionase family DNA binding protein
MRDPALLAIAAALDRLAAAVERLAPPPEPEPLLTVEDVQALLKLPHPRHVYPLADDLGAVRVGRRLRFKRARVERYLARRR